MSQITFASDASPSNVDLDANFTALFDLREYISTPAYVAASAIGSIGASGNLVWGVAGSVDRSVSANVNGVGTAAIGVNNSGSASALYGVPTGHAYVGSYAVRLSFSSAGVHCGGFDTLGNFRPFLLTSAPSLSTNGEMVFTLTSNTNLRISVRGSDGTTRVANITLA